MVDTLRTELALLPERVQTSTEAAVALELARQIDQGLLLATASRELTRVMGVLRAMAPAAPLVPDRPDAREGEVRSGVADLASRAAARRAAAAG